MMSGEKYNKDVVLTIFEKYELPIILIISIFLGIITTYKMFSINNNPIFYRDFAWPANIEALKNWLFYSWSDIGSIQNIDVLHRLPFNSILYPIAYFFGSYNSYSFLYLTITSLGLFSMYSLLSFMIKKFYSDTNHTTRIISSVVGAFTWIFSFTYMNNLGLEFGITFLPLSVLFFLKSFWEKISFKNIFLFSVSLSLSTAADVRYSILTSMLIFFFVISEIIRHGKIIITLQKTINIILITLPLFILLSLFWIAPSIFSALSGQIIAPPYVLSSEIYDMLSSKFTPTNYIRLLGYWWPYIPINYIDNSSILTTLSFSLAAFSFLSLIFIKNKGIKSFLSIILILSFIGIAVNKSFVSLPIMGWMFRTPYRWLIFLNFSYSALLALFATELSKHKKLFLSFIVFILTANSIMSAPLFTGNFDTYLSPVKIPNELKIEKDSILSNGDITKVLFYPAVAGGDMYWDNTILKWKTSPYEYLLTTGTITGLSAGLSPNVAFLNSIINEAFLSNNTRSARNLLTIFNIRYYIIHDDMAAYTDNERMMINYASDSNLFRKNKFIYSYNTNESSQFKIVSPILVKTGIDINNISLPFIPVDYGASQDLQPILSNKNFYLENKEDFIFSHLINNKNTTLLKPYDYTTSADETKGWAKINTLPYANVKSLTDIVLNQNFTHIDFDYGYGFAFTNYAEEPKITIPFYLAHDDTYKILMRAFYSDIGGSILLKAGDNSFKIDTNNPANRFMWADIGTIAVKKGNQDIQISNLYGTNAINIIIVVSEKDYNNISDRVISSLAQKQNESSFDTISLNEPPALISNYTKHNPTLYTVRVNATAPFMLAFAESYDSLWIAHVDKINSTSVKSETVRPVPLYSVINGFWINKTGDLDITIEYEPQKWFYAGAAVSITTLIACISYLVYNWHKNNRSKRRRNDSIKQEERGNIVNEEEVHEWSSSNYPKFMAFILLVTTAIILAFGESEAYANQLAVYAYFLLVIGIAAEFFEITLSGVTIQRIKVKLPKISRGKNDLKTARADALDFIADVAKNVFFSLLVFFLITLSYGVLVDWFFVGRFIKQLGYIIIVFLALALILRGLGHESFGFKKGNS